MVCSADGVVVRVRPREARGDVPAYEYIVRSERQAAVAVRIDQPVPAAVDGSDLGFPSACEEDWRLEGSTLVGRIRVEPDEEVRTVWGVREESHPSIDPPDLQVEPAGEASGEFASGDGPQGTLDLEEPGDVGGATDGVAGTRSLGGTGSAPAVGEDTLVAQLVRELESGGVDASHRTALADALELQASDSANAFVEHVQSKVERRADRLERDLVDIEESVDQLYGVKADASDVSSLKRGITDLDDKKVDAAELRDVRERIEEVQTTVARLVERVETLPDGEGFERLETQLDGLQNGLESLEAGHERLGQSHDELAAEAATEEDVEDVRGAYRDQVNAAKSDVAALRDALETEFVRTDDLTGEIDRRFNYGVVTLVLFAIGAAGLTAAVLLATQGQALTAAGTFAGGAVALLLWLRALRSGGDPADAVPLLG